MNKIGDRAPDFRLPDTGLAMRSLQELSEKKLVLAFFPGRSLPYAKRNSAPSAISSPAWSPRTPR